MNDGTANDTLSSLFDTIERRRRSPMEGSYTCYLFGKGLDKILKKVGEECAEVIVAAKNGDNDATIREICDLLYHVLVLMSAQDMEWSAVEAELEKRRAKIGNLKEVRQTDHNT